MDHNETPQHLRDLQSEFKNEFTEKAGQDLLKTNCKPYIWAGKGIVEQIQDAQTISQEEWDAVSKPMKRFWDKIANLSATLSWMDAKSRIREYVNELFKDLNTNNMTTQGFINNCRENIAEKVALRNDQPLEENIHLVWFSKTLQNMKALFWAPKEDNAYWECTFNGTKQQIYIDKYIKESNEAVDIYDPEKFSGIEES